MRFTESLSRVNDPERVSQDLEANQNPVQADAFDFESFFGNEPVSGTEQKESDDVEAEDELKSTSRFSASDLKKGLYVSAQKTEDHFEKRVNVQALDKGLNVVGNLVSIFGQLAASCGPLCLHALSGAGSAMGSAASASSGLGGLASAAGGLKFDGNGNVSFSGSVGELARKTGYSADAIKSGAVSVSDLIAALSISFGQGVSAVFGFGLIDVFANIIPDGKAA
jgi:hypothetical protein